MPRTRHTPRQRLIRDCEQLFVSNIQLHVESMKYGPPPPPYLILFHGQILTHLYQSRYLRPRVPLPTSTDLRKRVLEAYEPEYFQKIVRLTPEQLDALTQLISGSEQFRSKNEIFPQEPVREQLKVALFRLGTKGICTPKVAWAFGVSAGSVHNYTWRCVYAIEELVE
ncbi:hypothetical protein BGZ76_007872, partial [Entomortierella beljakovae]